MTCVQNNANLRLVSKRVIQLNIGPINRNPLARFDYALSKATKLPNEAVNMLFRRITDDLEDQNIMVSEDIAFQLVHQLVKQHANLSQRECFNVSNAYCQVQYDFKQNAARYYFGKLLG